MPQNHLLIIEDDAGSRTVVLEQDGYVIGRDPTCSIRLVSQFVSRCHAMLQCITEDGLPLHYRIIDGFRGKASANGILVNGKKVKTHDLQNEDQIVFGPQVKAVYYALEREAGLNPNSDPVDDATTRVPLSPEMSQKNQEPDH